MWSWFKFSNFRLALHTNLTFYTSLSKGLKLKVRKIWRLIPRFVDVAREKIGRGAFLGSHPILNRVKRPIEMMSLYYRRAVGKVKSIENIN